VGFSFLLLLFWLLCRIVLAVSLSLKSPQRSKLSWSTRRTVYVTSAVCREGCKTGMGFVSKKRCHLTCEVKTNTSGSATTDVEGHNVVNLS